MYTYKIGQNGLKHNLPSSLIKWLVLYMDHHFVSHWALPKPKGFVHLGSVILTLIFLGGWYLFLHSFVLVFNIIDNTVLSSFLPGISTFGNVVDMITKACFSVPMLAFYMTFLIVALTREALISFLFHHFFGGLGVGVGVGWKGNNKEVDGGIQLRPIHGSTCTLTLFNVMETFGSDGLQAGLLTVEK